MASTDVLRLVYPPESIFVVGYEFDDATRSIKVVCKVPSGLAYTINPIPYVTAENYVRCLSQACYLLAEHLLEHHLLPLDVTVEGFRTAAAQYELYYRSLSMVFHERMKPGEEFEMVFSLKNWRVIKRIQDFILFTFSGQRTVISGEMSFVFVGS